MELLSDPFALGMACLAVTIIGMGKGGFFGLGAMATPLLALALPPAIAAAILLPVLLAQDAVSVWSFRASWDRWIVSWMLPGAVAGIAFATFFAANVDEAMLIATLGVITLSFGIYRLWLERGGRIAAPSNSPGWVGTLFGVGMGVTSQIAHAGGPPFQMWVTPRRLDNQTYAGTTSVLFALVNWIKVPGFVAFGALNRQTLMAAVVLMPLAIITTLVAVRVIRRLDTARFYTMIHVIMVLLGGKLIWDGVT
ncbi:sulfite exporter TauE/SafE family protein [Sphingorhabdus lacus]|uniref:Probable membrane transporter protein n=1 Tax=Sphingorhabdus lacus TaxID=392610 RepID=A0A6I6L5M6_9SPHN|nr:sulfite exporter TauE/SafE family protein [Sphingorhabdus lacus]QGY79256.1 sulfite exporter TauE/SafE family protein [Sphingorhabdus lacus]